MWNIIVFCLTLVPSVFSSESICDLYPIDTDFGPDDCDKSKLLYYNPKLHEGCIPGCQYSGYRPGAPFICTATSPCPPGYKCDAQNCELDEDSCLKYYSFDKDYNNARWKPECLPDGTWAPKQCKGDRCFCFDPKGNRIFGEAFSAQSQNMTCACSRRRVEMEALGNHYFVSLHCDNIGNYEPLQCQDENCWCVESTTGEITSVALPEKLMTRLPCYDNEIVGDQYLRQCESHLHAQEAISDEYAAHGTMRTNFGTLRCQYDGSYGPIKVSGGRVACVWRDNSNIESYASETTSGISHIDCNCARDIKLFELAGMQLIHSCQGNGNYEPVQRDGELYYCIDSDGFRKSNIQANILTAADCALLK